MTSIVWLMQVNRGCKMHYFVLQDTFHNHLKATFSLQQRPLWDLVQLLLQTGTQSVNNINALGSKTSVAGSVSLTCHSCCCWYCWPSPNWRSGCGTPTHCGNVEDEWPDWLVSEERGSLNASSAVTGSDCGGRRALHAGRGPRGKGPCEQRWPT